MATTEPNTAAAEVFLTADDALLRQLAALFHVEDDGSITWPWVSYCTLGRVATPELEAALREYRERQGITNLM